MLVKKEQIPLLTLMLSVLFLFTLLFVGAKNYEFLIYVGVIVFFLALVLATNKKVNYPLGILWGLSIWAVMHMAGGGIFVGETRLYEMILIPIVGEPYNIFKYDQLVHAFGFGVATLLMFHLLKPVLIGKIKNWARISIVVVMAGLGVGALNEIIEFFATVVSPQTGVGGYENTALDLVANMVGAVIAMIYIYYKEK